MPSDLTPYSVEQLGEAPQPGGNLLSGCALAGQINNTAVPCLQTTIGSLPRGAGLAGLALAVVQAGLIQHCSHLALLLRRSLRLELGKGLGDVSRTEHGSLEVLKLLVEIGVAGGVLPR